jgi:Rieske Fe-S protein
MPMSDHDCQGCALSGDATRSRREFLREAAGAAAAALVTLGVLPAVARALPLGLAEPVGARTAGGEKGYAIPAADGVSIDKDEEVIIARWQGAVYAFALSCPHQNTALRWMDGDHRFQCPKHKSKYRPDGTFIEGRATRGMDRFAVRKAGNTVMVNLDALFREDDDHAEWEKAFVRL